MSSKQYIIRPAPQQSFGLFVRHVVSLAAGSRVETDTSSRAYAVRVNEATYRRWVASLPKPKSPEPAAAAKPAADPEPTPSLQIEPEPAPAAKAEPVKRKARKATTKSKAGA